MHWFVDNLGTRSIFLILLGAIFAASSAVLLFPVLCSPQCRQRHGARALNTVDEDADEDDDELKPVQPDLPQLKLFGELPR